LHNGISNGDDFITDPRQKSAEKVPNLHRGVCRVWAQKAMWPVETGYNPLTMGISLNGLLKCVSGV